MARSYGETPAETPALDADREAAGSSLPRFRVIDLGLIEGNDNMVHAINNAGSVVGAAAVSHGRVQGYVSDGRRSSLGTLGGAFSVAHSINNAGQIVGGSLTDRNEAFHAFLFSEGNMYDLNQLLVDASRWELLQAVGINDQGQIVGVGLLDGEDHGFLLNPADRKLVSGEHGDQIYAPSPTDKEKGAV